MLAAWRIRLSDKAFLVAGGILPLVANVTAAPANVVRRLGDRFLELSQEGQEQTRRQRSPRVFSVGRRTQQVPQDVVVCQDQMRWASLPWIYLSFSERAAWTIIGWTEQTWNAAHVPAQPTPAPPGGAMVPGGSIGGSSPRRLSGSGDDGDDEGQAPPRNPLVALARAAAKIHQRRATGLGPMNSSAYQANRPPADMQCYQNLAEDQQDAVRALKYTIATWHACKNPACPWPVGIPEASAPCLQKLLYLEAQYDYTVPWMNLSQAKRSALVVLGWDMGGYSWTTVDKPQKYGRPWEEMAMQEREAAEFLGYTQSEWHGCVAETPCIQLLQHLDSKLDQLSWATMPSGIRSNLETLGWSTVSWMDGVRPSPYMTAWSDLSLDQSIAARILGYVHSTWHGCPNAPCTDRFAYVQQRYQDVAWTSMKLAYQWAWELLGHDQVSWDLGGPSNTIMLTQSWEELTPEQQSQATFLGHSQGTWQGCSLADASANATFNVSTDPLRPVRVRMTIQRPFSDISGNVFGASLDQLPTSFIALFEASVARALFCENPPLGDGMSTYTGPDGEPLCLLQSNLDKQQGSEHRLRVVTVMEGSIIVDFIIEPNTTHADPTAVFLFEELGRQLDLPNSPIALDSQFGSFAQVASVIEVPFDYLTYDQRNAALALETIRGAYDSSNACILKSDVRNDINNCQLTAGARTHAFLRFPLLLVLLGAVLMLRT